MQIYHIVQKNLVGNIFGEMPKFSIWQVVYLADCMPIYNYYDAIADNCLNGLWYHYVQNR